MTLKCQYATRSTNLGVPCDYGGTYSLKIAYTQDCLQTEQLKNTTGNSPAFHSFSEKLTLIFK